MDSIKSFEQLISHLKGQTKRKRIVVVCANDDHSEYAIARALEEGIAEFILVGDSEALSKYPALKTFSEFVKIVHVTDPDEAARRAVQIVRDGDADILMKGLINTDNLLRVILDKEHGLLPKGRVLTHLALVEISSYHKLLFFTDAAVIPQPTLEQRVEMLKYAIQSCHAFGIEKPKIGLVHCTEKVSPKFPNSVDYVELVKMCRGGVFGDAVIDGPMDVKTACDKECGEIKGISSPVDGEADVLMFPNIESGNVFYKTVSLFARADMAGLLQGPICPVVVTSRGDSGLSKYYSIAMACLTCN